jgi:hypothetical protein
MGLFKSSSPPPPPPPDPGVSKAQAQQEARAESQMAEEQKQLAARRNVRRTGGMRMYCSHRWPKNSELRISLNKRWAVDDKN